jgi:hypothetical protein
MQTKWIYFLLSLLLLTGACKNNQNASADNPTETVQEPPSPPPPPAVAEPSEELVLQEPPPESAGFHKRAQEELSDSVFARIQRTACFGRCPIYTLTVYESGYTEYHGEKWVDKEGKFTTTISREKMQALRERANEIGYFSLNNEYDSPYVTDLPSTITTLRHEEDFKTIVNRYQGPEKLREFEEFFDELFAEVEWERIDE